MCAAPGQRTHTQPRLSTQVQQPSSPSCPAAMHTCPSMGKLRGSEKASRWRCSVRPTRLAAGSTYSTRARSRWLGLQRGRAGAVRAATQLPVLRAVHSVPPAAGVSTVDAKQQRQLLVTAPELLAPVGRQVGAQVEGVHRAAVDIRSTGDWIHTLVQPATPALFSPGPVAVERESAAPHTLAAGPLNSPQLT